MPKDMLIQHLLKRLRLPAMSRQYKKLAEEAAPEGPEDDHRAVPGALLGAGGGAE